MSSNVISNATLFKVAVNTCIPAKTESYIGLVRVNHDNNLKLNNIMLEPFNFSNELPSNCIIAKSAHEKMKLFISIL